MRKRARGEAILPAALAVVLAAGCATWFMNGATLAPAGFQPQKVLVTYRAEGVVPEGTSYFLVLTEKGEVMFERGFDGSGTLFETRWTDDRGDHFAGWVETSHGYEFVVPKDRRKPAKRYVYPGGSYSIQNVGGQWRPVPFGAVAPVTTLIPQ